MIRLQPHYPNQNKHCNFMLENIVARFYSKKNTDEKNTFVISDHT